MTNGGSTWALIDLAALRSNYRLACQLAGRREVIAVVKADAYGHGSVEVARTLETAGCRRLAVVTVDEAITLRDAGIATSVLLLGGVHTPEEAALAVQHGLTPVLHDRAGLACVASAVGHAAPPQQVQVEIDSGMHRMGIAQEDAVGLLAEITAEARLRLEGVFTHFASADDVSPDASLEQLARFRDVLDRARKRGVDPGLVHADNSAALLQGKTLAEALPEAGAVRPGLMLYGARSSVQQGPDRRLRPVMSVRARVVAVRDVAAGEAVGYGAGYRARAATRVATLPLGYADGVPCALFGCGEVWLAGARRPMVGRVSMDYVTVDIGDAPVRVGDEATFFGVAGSTEATLGQEGVPVEESASAADTHAYELLVRVGDRVPRTYLDEV